MKLSQPVTYLSRMATNNNQMENGSDKNDNDERRKKNYNRGNRDSKSSKRRERQMAVPLTASPTIADFRLSLYLPTCTQAKRWGRLR